MHSDNVSAACIQQGRARLPFLSAAPPQWSWKFCHSFIRRLSYGPGTQPRFKHIEAMRHTLPAVTCVGRGLRPGLADGVQRLLQGGPLLQHQERRDQRHAAGLPAVAVHCAPAPTKYQLSRAINALRDDTLLLSKLADMEMALQVAGKCEQQTSRSSHVAAEGR